MFFTAQKIVVLASSTSKTGAKVRKGSLGYVSSLGTPVRYLSIPAILTPAKVVFTRFGNEKRERNETKIIFLLHPSSVIKNLTNIQRSMNKKVKSALDMTDKLKLILKNENLRISRPDIVVAAPSKVKISLVKNKIEFQAWVSSVIQSGLFHPIFALGKKNDEAKLKNILLKNLPEVSTNFKRCLKHKGEIDKLTDNLYQDEYKRIKLVEQFKKYLHLYMRNNIEDMAHQVNIRSLSVEVISQYFWLMVNNHIVIPEFEKTHRRFILRNTHQIVMTWAQILDELNLS